MGDKMMKRKLVEIKPPLFVEYDYYSREILKLSLTTGSRGKKKLGDMYYDRALTCTDVAENYRQKIKIGLAQRYCAAALKDVQRAKDHYLTCSDTEQRIAECDRLTVIYESNMQLLNEEEDAQLSVFSSSSEVIPNASSEHADRGKKRKLSKTSEQGLFSGSLPSIKERAVSQRTAPPGR
ncbi:MAG: hypothetical protein Q8R24_10875 [Legionellaceae bacterium]|nr:hypothetical protein [Legionellaceae bacterium]